MSLKKNETGRNQRDREQPLLNVNALVKHFPVRGGILNREVAEVQAVDGVTFSVKEGETLGIVGESGCGKSTTARLLMRLIEPDSGDVTFDGYAIGTHGGLSIREMRRAMQMVFQDSYSSLNPRLPIEDTIAFGPVVHGLARREANNRARDILAKVGLQPKPIYPALSARTVRRSTTTCEHRQGARFKSATADSRRSRIST